MHLGHFASVAAITLSPPNELDEHEEGEEGGGGDASEDARPAEYDDGLSLAELGFKARGGDEALVVATTRQTGKTGAAGAGTSGVSPAGALPMLKEI